MWQLTHKVCASSSQGMQHPFLPSVDTYIHEHLYAHPDLSVATVKMNLKEGEKKIVTGPAGNFGLPVFQEHKQQMSYSFSLLHSLRLLLSRAVSL